MRRRTLHERMVDWFYWLCIPVCSDSIFYEGPSRHGDLLPRVRSGQRGIGYGDITIIKEAPMMVSCYGSEFDIPDILINKFVSDFDTLPGSGFREGIEQLRSSVSEIVDIISEEPELLEEPEYHTDFIRALAMKQAMDTLGILYDA